MTWYVGSSTRIGPFEYKELAEHYLQKHNGFIMAQGPNLPDSIKWPERPGDYTPPKRTEEVKAPQFKEVKGKKHHHKVSEPMAWFILPNNDQSKKIGPFHYKTDALRSLREDHKALIDHAIVGKIKLGIGN
jgi:hypothetical protein